MANPTFDQLFGTNQTPTNEALALLGITPAVTDARLAVQRIVALLEENYAALSAANVNLSTYSILKEAENVDIDTQRQIFTFTFDMKIAATTVEDEPA